MWMSALRAPLIVLTCVITSMVATTAAVQDQAIDYKVITLPVKVRQMKFQHSSDIDVLGSETVNMTL